MRHIADIPERPITNPAEAKSLNRPSERKRSTSMQGFWKHPAAIIAQQDKKAQPQFMKVPDDAPFLL
jgi:hypothetical protein